jgi:predicted CXXCH cytochrome family protein
MARAPRSLGASAVGIDDPAASAGDQCPNTPLEFSLRTLLAHRLDAHPFDYAAGATMPSTPSRRATIVGALMLSTAAWLLVLACSHTHEPEPARTERLAADEPAPLVAAAPLVTHAGAPGYLGSAACAECHEKEHALWEGSLHSKMEQAATPASVIGDFTEAGTVVPAEAPGKRIVMQRRGDAYFIEAPAADGRPVVYPIERTIGNRYKQRYLTRLPNGALHTLPVQWFEKDQKFVEWHHKASVKVDSGDFWLDDTWAWQLKCAGCHTTGLDLGWDAAAKSYDTRFVELAIGCESCHGPGQAHVAARGGKGNILCPSSMTSEQQLDTCGKCHSRGSAGPKEGAPAGLPAKLAYPYNMLPGTDLDDAYVQITPATHAKDFWKDGSSLNHHQQLTDYRGALMRMHGGAKAPHCTTCHDPHDADALKASIDDNRMCVDCHKDLAAPADLAAHTGHGGDPLKNPGARCVECHMPRIVSHAGSQKLRSHTFWNPDPRKSRETETPDACLLCHKDKDSAWSEAAAGGIWKK